MNRILALAVLAAGACPAQSEPAAAVQVTYSVTIDPSFSPDGKRMVYITVVAGVEQLFIADADGGHPRQITHDDYGHEDPSWSPDGKHIAYVSLKDGGEVISIIDTEGGHAEALTPAGKRTIHPHWSPDSQRIIYCTDDDLAPPAKNDADIEAIDLATRKITTVISGGVNTYPALSPDGKHIVFRRMLGESNSEVFIADADGANPRNLTSNPSFDGWPSWSPDGRQIAFASDRGGNYQIHVMNADGSNARRVSDNDGRGTAPEWSKDGMRIYFPVCRKTPPGRGCEIYSVEAK